MSSGISFFLAAAAILVVVRIFSYVEKRRGEPLLESASGLFVWSPYQLLGCEFPDVVCRVGVYSMDRSGDSGIRVLQKSRTAVVLRGFWFGLRFGAPGDSLALERESPHGIVGGRPPSMEPEGSGRPFPRPRSRGGFGTLDD